MRGFLSRRKHQFLAVASVLRLVLATVLLIAGFSKVSDATVFNNHLVREAGFSEPLASFIYHVFPSVEIYLGLLLLIHYRRLYVLQMTAAFTAALFIYNIWLYSSKRAASNCGCLGQLAPEFLENPLLRGSSIFLLGALALVTYRIATSSSPGVIEEPA